MKIKHNRIARGATTFALLGLGSLGCWPFKSSSSPEAKTESASAPVGSHDSMRSVGGDGGPSGACPNRERVMHAYKRNDWDGGTSRSFACILSRGWPERCSGGEGGAGVHAAICREVLHERLARAKSANLGNEHHGLGELPEDIWSYRTGGPTFLVALKRFEEAATSARVDQQLLVEARAAADDAIELKKAYDTVTKIPEGCDGWKQVNTLATSNQNAATAAFLGRVAEKRKRDAVETLTRDVEELLRKPYEIQAMSEPKSLLQRIAAADKAKTEIACFDPGAATKVEQVIAAASSRYEDDIEYELKCRATPKCMGDRVAVDVCGLVAQKRQTEAELRRLRKYGRKHGVVNLTEIGQLSEDLQFYDEQIRLGKARYKAAAKKPFSTSVCAKLTGPG